MTGLFSRRKLKYIIPLLLAGFLMVQLLTSYHYAFDRSSFSADNTYAHIEELSAPDYAGRLAGTEGNLLALEYVEDYFAQIGIEPGGENGSYYQNFNSMVPVENSPSYMQILDEEGKILHSFEIGTDYRYELNGYGGNGTLTADLFYLDQYIREYDPAELTGKVLVNRTMLSSKDMEYAIEHGARGFIAISRNGLGKEPADLQKKQGKTIPVNLMEPNSFATLAEYAHEGRRIQLNTDVSFQLLETPNLLGTIPGRSDEYIIISAHIDGLGQEGANYYPGALDGASGVGMVLELARTAKAQATPPEKTLVFAIWNNQEHGLQGSDYYTHNPIYPLEKSQVIVLNNLGFSNSKQLYFDSNGDLGEILRNKLRSYTYEPYYDSMIRELTRELTAGKGADHASFLTHDLPAVLVEQANHYDIYEPKEIHTYDDTIAQIDQGQLALAAEPLLTYLRIDGFGQMAPANFSKTELFILLLLLLTSILIYVFYLGQRFRPGRQIFGHSLRHLYHSVGYTLFLKTAYYLAVAFIIILAIAFIAYLPPDFKLKITNGEIHTNFSPALTLNQSMLYIQSLFTDGFGMSQGRTMESTVKVSDILSWSFFRSLKLVVAALLVACTLGIIKGIFDGYRARDKAVGSIAALSLPDILIVVLVQEFLILLGNHGFDALVRTDQFSKFILPLICLSIIPTAYVSRLASTAVREEMRKDYVRAARAKGLSAFQILYKHLAVGVVIKVVEAIPALLTMIFSNLMIIEYVYYYPGLIYNLFTRYARHDTVTFIGLALALGLMYVVLSSLARLFAYLLNPLRREGKL